jgi:hypothetical protein
MFMITVTILAFIGLLAVIAWTWGKQEKVTKEWGEQLLKDVDKSHYDLKKTMVNGMKTFEKTFEKRK